MAIDRNGRDLLRTLAQDDFLRVPARWTQEMDEVAQVVRFRALCLVCLRTIPVADYTHEQLAEMYARPGDRDQGTRMGIHLRASLQIGFRRHACLFTEDPRVIGWEQSQVVAQRLERSATLLAEEHLRYVKLTEAKLGGGEETLARCLHEDPTSERIMLLNRRYSCECPPHCICRNKTDGNCSHTEDETCTQCGKQHSVINCEELPRSSVCQCGGHDQPCTLPAYATVTRNGERIRVCHRCDGVGDTDTVLDAVLP